MWADWEAVKGFDLMVEASWERVKGFDLMVQAAEVWTNLVEELMLIARSSGGELR